MLQNDIDEFKISGYNGNIYEVFNYTLPITTRQNFTGSQFQIFSDSIYLDETLGTMIVGEDFLTSKFGEIEYLAVSEAFNPSGVIITDYVADSILLKNTYYKGKTYHDIIGDYSFSTGLYNYGYVNAIIKTNYKEKHNELFTQINYTSTNNINGLFENELFIKFTNDIYSKLGFSYSLNRNLKKEIYEKIDFCWLNRLTIDGNDYLPNSGDYLMLDALNEFNLNDNQIAMNYKKYNEIFGTEYTTSNLNDFIPHKIVIEQYRYADYTKKKVILSVEVEIVKIYDKQLYLGSFYVNENLLKKYKENLVFTKGLYFDSNENLDIVIEVANKLNFEQKLFVVEAIHTMTKAVDVFIPIFELIATVLCGGIIFILVNFSTKMIKDKMHDIGILKALGTQNRSIGIVFGIQIVLIAIVTMLMSTVGYYFFIDLANDILIASLKELAPGRVMLDLDFLKFKMVVFGFNIVLIIALSLISLVIPMIKIKNIKPVKIIKTKE